MHDLIALFFEVIAFVINLLLVGFFLVVLLFAVRVIMALIILMAAFMLLFVAIALVALMVVAALATMLPVALVTAASDKKMSCLFLLWLFFLLELVKDAGHFIRSLTLLKKSYEQKRVRGHCFVCFRILVLMCLRLRKEDFFPLLLCCGQLHC